MAKSLSYGLQNLSLNENYVMVAGIDFGTTFSSYAFSFRSTEARPNSHKEIKMNKNWGTSLGYESYKTSTCVLTDPDGKFHSFGYEAENKFAGLEQDQVRPQDGYNLYRNFKMLLHKQGTTLNSNVSSTSGNIRPAIDVFSMALDYLKDHMLKAIALTVASEPDISLIRWVLTVPAIWSEESKRFMRQAAYQAGLITDVNSKQLLIALEPEAASVFCRSSEVTDFIGDEQVEFKGSQKMLIIDAGGGTVDVTAHELLVTGAMKEIIPPSGGPWGGTNVDDNFVHLMDKVFGTGFLNKFRKEQPQEWLSLMMSFESCKKHTDFKTNTSLRISISWALGNAFSEHHNGRRIDDAIKEKSKTLGVSFNNGTLIINYATAKSLFEPVITKIVDHIRHIMKDQKMGGLDYLLLVGGFSDCQFLQDAFKTAFSEKATVLIPNSAQLAIIRGAVLFGHQPDQICSRIAKMTYGIEIQTDFDYKEHDDSKMAMNDYGEAKCVGLFSSFVTRGDTLNIGEAKILQYTTPEGYTTIDFTIFGTTEKHAKYIDEPGVNRLGCVTLENPHGPLGKKLEVRVTFGGTELLFEARDLQNDEDFPVQTTIDFLSD